MQGVYKQRDLNCRWQVKVAFGEFEARGRRHLRNCRARDIALFELVIRSGYLSATGCNFRWRPTGSVNVLGH